MMLIDKGYFVVEKLVFNVRIKSFLKATCKDYWSAQLSSDLVGYQSKYGFIGENLPYPLSQRIFTMQN